MTCDVADGEQDPYTVFRCSRELVSCTLLPFVADTNWADNARMCRETKASRLLLIPFTLLSAVLVGVYGMRVYAARRTERSVVVEGRVQAAEPDMVGRVHKVEDEEDWEVAEVHEPPAYEQIPLVVSEVGPGKAQEASAGEDHEVGDLAEKISYTDSVTRSSSK
jgi:hypothetical protein